jgi:hypothetical protein
MEKEMIELTYLFMGMFAGFIFGYIFGSRTGILGEPKTIRYPDPKEGDERPPGACVEQPEVQPIVIEIKDNNKHTVGAYIENWAEVINNLTPEQKARTKENVP